MRKRISPITAAVATACVIGLGGVVLAQSGGTTGNPSQVPPPEQMPQHPATQPSDGSTSLPPTSSPSSTSPSQTSPSTSTTVPPSDGTYQRIDGTITDRASGTSGSMANDPNAMRAARSDRN